MGIGSPEQLDLIQRGPATANGDNHTMRKVDRHELCALR